MQNYNEFRVVEVYEATGEMKVVWYDDTRDGQGKLVTALKDQTVLEQGHKIPVEAEQNNWTREMLRDFWVLQIEGIADIPAWAKTEADSTVVEYKTMVRVR